MTQIAQDIAKPRHRVLFVDDEANILSAMVRVLRKEGYDVFTAASGLEALEAVKAADFSLVVSDCRMPGMDGPELLARVRQLSPDTVRFMLTGHADMDAVVSAINKGEISRYITKPWNDDELRAAVRDGVERYGLASANRALLELTRKQNEELCDLTRGLEAKVEAKTGQIRENFFAFIRMFSNLMELYDPTVGGHGKRVARMSRDFAESMGLEAQELDLVEAAALLHTIGLVGIPREIMEKDERRLSDKEREILRQAPVLSQGLLSSIDMLLQAGIIIRSHMERFDGKGSPDGLKDEEIHIGSRILAVMKRYDRLMHKGALKGDTIASLVVEKGKAFDPDIVDRFVNYIGGSGEKGTRSAMVPLVGLEPGMVLAENFATNGRLLLTRGTVLTDELIGMLTRLHHLDPISDEVRIVR